MLGTSVIDMLFHNPIILAKRFATLDVLSEGRVIAGRLVIEVNELMNSFKY